jgi:hypothetical protein
VAGGLVTFSNDLILTSIKEVVSFQDLKINIEPNPSNGQFIFSTFARKGFEKADVKIYDLTGNMVYQFIWNGEQTNVDLTRHPKGMYILTVSTSDGIKTKKLLIQ